MLVVLINSAVGYVSAYVLNLRLYIFLKPRLYVFHTWIFVSLSQLICGSIHHESFLERSLRQAMSLRFLSLSLLAAMAAVLMILARETRACACSRKTNKGIRWTRFHLLYRQTQKNKNRHRDGRWHRRRQRHLFSTLEVHNSFFCILVPQVSAARQPSWTLHGRTVYES